MPIASLSSIEKTFGQRTLFDQLELSIDRGERIGLIGPNGAGKSTLFKMLIGEMVPDAGTVAIARSVKIGYLSQDPVFDPANTVLDEAELAFAELHRISHRLRDLEHRMADQSGDSLEKTLNAYQDAQHDFDLAGGYAWRHKLEATLLGVGLEPNAWEQLVPTLSGGQRSRLALARLLIGEPDLLLMDEPTNHLDLAAIEWVENYLLDFSGAVLLISHDRYLLDRLATRIVDLRNSRLASYPGNYSAYLTQRELEKLTQQRAYEKQHADIEKQAEYVRRFKAGQRARQAKGREKRLDRLMQSDAIIGAVTEQRHIHLSLNTDQRAGNRVLRTKGLSKAYENKPLWDDLGFEIERGERIGILGPNGAGKTTLLEVLLGRRDADDGDIQWGANLRIGYYDQGLDDFDPENSPLEELSDGRDAIPEKQIRDVLAMMLFQGDDVHKPISLLSGGERARVRLAELLLDRPNVLLLDEPTNHLDIASREALEGALSGFDGTVLCVSHDRYFLDKLAKRMFVLRPPNLVDFEGNYSAWATRLDREHQAEAERKSAAARSKSRPKTKATPPKPPRKSNDSHRRPFGRLAVEELEREIAQTEKAVNECQGRCADAETFKDPALAKRVQQEYQELANRLKGLEAEYFAREA
jgi:ATP-binding cassette subfamily F protein 3